MKPTEQQQNILNYEGNAVIVAAPGSGKTYVISQKIKQNLKTFNTHEGVIAISYTNKASKELENRSLSNGENPMSSFFGTIDRFFLSEIIIPFGKQIFGLPEADIKVIKINTLNEHEQELFQWFNRNLTLEKISNENISILKKYFFKGIVLIETIGILANYVFTNSIACQKYMKARYKAIYIDEYQDSGIEQHQLFIKIKKLGIIAIAVGDLNQSIYAFSGKDSRFLKELENIDDFKFFMLNKNHRCHSSIINYSNYLLNSNTELIENDDICVYYRQIEGTEKSIANWIDSQILDLEKLFDVKKRNQIAILTRGNRTGKIINDELKVPHKLFISNDLDTNLNVWSGIFSNLLYYIFDEHFKFIEVVEDFTSYDKLTRNELKKLNNYKKLLDDKNISDKLCHEQIKSIFIEIAKIIAPNSENLESLNLLSSVLNSPIELASYKPAKDNEINIITLHKSKGLEFDVVIHLDLYEWVFPSKQPGPNNDFNNPVFSNFTQDMNLHYVGITRARKGCVLISSTQRTNDYGLTKIGKESEFLHLNNIKKLRL